MSDNKTPPAVGVALVVFALATILATLGFAAFLLTHDVDNRSWLVVLAGFLIAGWALEGATE